MRISQAKHFKPFVDAAAEGKTIQMRRKQSGSYKDWTDLDDTYCNLFASTDLEDGYEYRIKPEPRLRPWKPEEVPVGAYFRTKTQPPLVSQILMRWEFGFAFCDSAKILNMDLVEALEKAEHSLDNGKTWLPCGVEEAQ